MSLLVVGTIAFDEIETPSGRVHDETGGSATYFSLAASRFSRVFLVGAVGTDFPRERFAIFDGRDVDLAGVETVAGGKTFRWAGRYQGDMNSAETLDTQLNVLATFDPKLPAGFADAPFVFLANAAPAVQLKVLDATQKAADGGRRFVMADTMNIWIEHARAELLEVLRRVDAVILNDGEARMLTGERNLIRAGQKILELGPKVAIVKKGEHGAFLFSTYVFHAMPAYPVGEVVDPTGAGDSFAGGLMGYLARTGRVSIANLRRGMVYGTVAASFTVSDFGTRAIARATREDFDLRLAEFEHFVS
ncbi:MAG: sugar kinase [Planctomycetes bacterium]|nr:sugar kinase [Planctomycetota bacterium]